MKKLMNEGRDVTSSRDIDLVLVLFSLFASVSFVVFRRQSGETKCSAAVPGTKQSDKKTGWVSGSFG